MPSRLCYLRKGTVYVPFMAKTVAGFSQGIEPVARPLVSETSELLRVLREELAREMPIIPTPDRDAKRTNIPEYARVRSWRAFEREAVLWTVTHHAIWKIKRNKRIGTPHDADFLIEFPPGTSSDEVAERLVQVVQDKARELGQL